MNDAEYLKDIQSLQDLLNSPDEKTRLKALNTVGILTIKDILNSKYLEINEDNAIQMMSDACKLLSETGAIRELRILVNSLRKWSPDRSHITFTELEQYIEDVMHLKVILTFNLIKDRAHSLEADVTAHLESQKQKH